MQDGAGKGDQLPLAGREVVAALPHRLVQAVVQLVDKAVRVHVAAHLHDPLVGVPFPPQDDVAADGARKQEHILQHLPKVAADAGDLDLADVHPVDQDLPPLELVIAADQREDGGLARAGGAHKGHRLAGLDVEGDPLQHPLAGHVAEPDVPELDLAPDLRQLDRVGGVHHPGLQVQDGEHFFGRSHGRLEPVELLRQVLDGVVELGDVHIEGDNGAARDGLPQEGVAVQIAHAAQIKQAQHRADVQHIYQRPEHAKDEDLVPLGLAQRLAAAAEVLHPGALPAKDLGDLDAREVLGQVGVDVGGAVLDTAVGTPGKFAEDHRKQHDKGHKAQHHQGQLVVDQQHGPQDAQDHKTVFGQVDKQVGEHHGDGVGVVGHTGDQLAHRDLVQLLVGQGLDVGEQVLPQIGDDPLARLLEDDRLEIGADHGKDQDARIDRHHPEQSLQGEIPHQHLLHLAYDQGGHDVVHDGKKHQQPRRQEAAQVGPGIMGQPPDDLAVGDVALKAHGGLFVLDRGIGEDQQGRHRADQPACQHKGIQLHHELPPPSSSSSRCRSTIRR